MPRLLSRLPFLIMLLVLISHPAARAAQWRTFAIPEAGLRVEIPASIFTDQAATADGRGRVFYTGDRRADLTVVAMPNPEGDTPALFLARMQPPERIQYRRVTSGFFVVSSVKNGRTWYNRCNRARDTMNCVLINYPAAENRQWDDVVTRISLSLSR